MIVQDTRDILKGLFESSDIIIDGMDLFHISFTWCCEVNLGAERLIALIVDFATKYCQKALQVLLDYQVAQ